MGICYGESMRGVKRILSNEEEVLAYVKRCEGETDAQQITLLYSVMDAALQSLAGFGQSKESGNRKLLLPFALEELEVRRKPGAECIVYAQKCAGGNAGGEKYDISILDEKGNVLVLLHHFMGRYYQGEEPQAVTPNKKEILYRLQKGEITLDEAKKLLG